jgi:hypothetical protein
MSIGRSFSAVSFVALAFAANASVAQSAPPSRATNIAITKAEAFSLGRGEKSDSMHVLHRVDYCLRGGSPQDFGTLRVGFTTKKMSQDTVSRGKGKGTVRGELSSMQEPLDGRNQRCGSFNFSVHADTLLSLLPLAKESEPRVVVETIDGKLIAFAAVSDRGTLQKSR